MRISALAVLTAIIAITVFAEPNARAVDGKKAVYIGGTVSSIKENSEAVLDVSNDTQINFQSKKVKWQIPYSSVTALEYGQHAGRRVGLAIAISPVALLSKKRRHYLTINFSDGSGKDQVAIFEVGKDAIRTSLTILETRTGKKVEFEDDEARKVGTK